MDLDHVSSKDLRHQIESTWNAASLKPNVFRYQLRVESERQIPGRFGFLIQLNENRTSLRRHPQKITSVRPEFSPDGFNFNKTTEDERLFEVNFKGHCIRFLVNNSPLTRNHCLICPDSANNHPQVLNDVALEFSLALLAKLADRRYRIGFNSPGALASVNHLHMHLIEVDQELFTEKVALKPTSAYEQWHMFDESFPCLNIVRIAKFEDDFQLVAQDILRVVNFLCDKCIPHNVIITVGQSGVEQSPTLRTIIYLRPSESLERVKELSGFNIGCFELAGYVVVGTEAYYNELTEEKILQRIKYEMEIERDEELLQDLLQLIKK